MKSATKIKDLSGFTGEAALYKLSEPLDTYDYVVVSTASVWGAIETYIFGSNEKGEVLSWSELDGSERGIYDHEKALENAGYCIE
jgi:hypothetical protein